MANTFRKIYKKTGNSGSSSDYQLVGNVGVNGVELDIMKGATSSADGEIGLVPKPTTGQQNRILTGNGTFQTVKSILTSESLIKNNLTTTTSGSILDASQGKALNDKITSLQNTVNNLHRVQIVSLVNTEHGSTFSFTNSRTAGYAFYLLLIRLGSNYEFRIIGHNGNYVLSATDSSTDYYTTHFRVNITIKNSGTRYTVTLSNPCGSRTGSYFTGTFIYVGKIYGIII